MSVMLQEQISEGGKQKNSVFYLILKKTIL